MSRAPFPSSKLKRRDESRSQLVNLSFNRRVYYRVKPMLPASARRVIRRFHIDRVLGKKTSVWPILESSATPPDRWPGWPDGKRFALILTHDVEGADGYRRTMRLMDMERALGFRSSFNFVPEGNYQVEDVVRERLGAEGFEVGVHGLRHDGHDLHSAEIFKNRAAKINHYLNKWKAVGFRAPYMHHNLEWFHGLNIQYDASTFDTDPFEPQPDGVDTIFPFWVSRGDGGYAELPYTLPQDSTLFVYGRETNPRIWLEKLEWIADKGGMVLVNVHPDYMTFDGSKGAGTYPSIYYESFLRHILERHQGAFWNPLAREAAAFVKAHKQALPAPVAVAQNNPRRRKIWIDLENTPHIPFFNPVIRELRNQGCDVVLTARDAFQTCEMADRSGMKYQKIGRHYGQNRILKAIGLGIRALQLLPFALRERPDLALNHGARAQILICNLLRIPSVLIMDYEHTSTPPMVRPTWEIVPSVVSDSTVHCKSTKRLRKYRGIKEDVYVPDFRPDGSIIGQLGLDGGVVVVTVRPPATEAHYHNPESEILFERFMDRIAHASCVKAVLLPRNKKQELQICSRWPHWFQGGKVIIPGQLVDGLNLLWHSDLVVSGGGTMNREAAALGVPVYSIFRGPIGAVDRHLQSEGRLVLIESVDDVVNKIPLQHRRKQLMKNSGPRQALEDIVHHLLSIATLQAAWISPHCFESWQIH